MSRATELPSSTRNRWSQRVQLGFKRLIDFVFAAVALVFATPLMIGVAAAIYIADGFPIFYRQRRPGLEGHPIGVWKFRTMTSARNQSGVLLPDAERITRVGRWLRERSLDELPQLLNVLSGDMSFVGPRPLLMRYLPRYTARQRLRHRMKPGITGLAQIRGRNAIDWESRLEFDVQYVEDFDVGLDLKILVLTVWKVLRRENVLAGGGSEFDEFWGTDGVPKNGPRALPVEADEEVPELLDTKSNGPLAET